MTELYKEHLSDLIKNKGKRSLTDTLFDGLSNLILSGKLPIGHRINEQVLAKDLSISRTPVRKAINQLIETRLVENVENRGAVVININQSTIIEAYNLQLALEKQMYTEVIKNITRDEINELLAYFSMIKQNEYQYNHPQIDKVSDYYYDRLLNIANTPLVEKMLLDIKNYIKKFTGEASMLVKRKQIALRGKIQILNALANNEDKALENILKQQNNYAMRSVLAHYQMHIAHEANPKEWPLFICNVTTCPLHESINKMLH